MKTKLFAALKKKKINRKISASRKKVTDITLGKQLSRGLSADKLSQVITKFEEAAVHICMPHVHF